MKGKCIDTEDSTMLQLKQEYFLFPAGPDYYYVSKFDNANAHFGCYAATKFQIIEQEDCTKVQRYKAYKKKMKPYITKS